MLPEGKFYSPTVVFLPSRDSVRSPTLLIGGVQFDYIANEGLRRLNLRIYFVTCFIKLAQWVDALSEGKRL